MTEELQSRGTKDRSPNFPFISLERALERAGQLYEKEKRSATPFKVAAEHWRYSPTSSGALQTAAALKQYGLLVDEGSGKDRRVKLTEMALRILLDKREDSTEREHLKRQAALTPPIATEINQKYPEELPSDGTLHHFLVLDRGFNPDNAKNVVKVLKANEGFTHGAMADTISEDIVTDKDSEHRDYPAPTPLIRPKGSDAPVDRSTPKGQRSTIGAVATASYMVTISGEGAITREAIEKAIKYLELVKDDYPPAAQAAQVNAGQSITVAQSEP
jgi:hypothetical protein